MNAFTTIIESTENENISVQTPEFDANLSTIYSQNEGIASDCDDCDCQDCD